MSRRSLFAALFVVCLLALAGTVPVAAQLAGTVPVAAQVDTVDCAVGWVGGPEWVVLTMGSLETRRGIGDAGAFCTELIAGGQYVGADKFKDWESAGYQRLCIVRFTSNESAIVHVWPDYDSQVQGYRLCLAGQDVYYFTGAEMTSPTHRVP